MLIKHRLMLPPNATGGRVTFIATPGFYTIEDVVLEVEFQGTKSVYKMMHTWPVRNPRPVAQKLPGNAASTVLG